MAKRTKSVDEMTVYELYLHHLLQANEQRLHMAKLYDDGKAINPNTGDFLDAAIEQAWNAHRDQRDRHVDEAETIRFKHLKPFETQVHKYIDDAYSSKPEKGVRAAYKQARDKLWREEHKFRNSRLASEGVKGKPYNRANYNLDFE